MKTLFSITLLSLLLLATYASAPPRTHAITWVDSLMTCTGNYIDRRNGAWTTWNNSSQGPADQSQRDYSLDVAFNNYQGCNSVVNVPYMEPDF